MKEDKVNIKLIIRFTLNFIIHQILLFLVVSIPAIFYIVILKANPKPLIINLVIWSIIIVYLLYCLFYGYYIALPMYDVINNIQKLSKGSYLSFREKSKKIFRYPSNKLYREVYENLETLSLTLQENEKKRKEFDKLKQEWSAGVTHDLKTPLSYISGYTDILLSDKHKWEENEKIEFLQFIKEKATHMEELINDLGIAFKMDQRTEIETSSEKVEIVELIRRIVAETANMPFDKKNSFEIHGDEKPIYIIGDERLLRRAFSNLLVNAVVHNPTETIIKVKIYLKDQVEIHIVDNGKGMDEVSVKNLFERYYRGTATDIPVGGTGLGMAIVKQIITAHKGIIDVESKIKEGTTIIVSLPLVDNK